MTRIRRDLLALVALGLAAALPAGARDEREGTPFGLGAIGGKEPITVTADRLEYDYRGNVVTYRGQVEVTQGQTHLKSNELTITLAAAPKGGSGTEAGTKAGDGATPAAGRDAMSGRVQEIVATGSVRIDQGSRWATGGRAVYDQARRTVILSENPVLHDGPNEVQGDRVVVFLDEDRSVVEGGRKRVKAVLYPDDDKRPGAAAGGPGGTGSGAASGSPAREMSR